MQTQFTFIAATLSLVLMNTTAYADHKDRDERSHSRHQRHEHGHRHQVSSEVIYAPVVYVEPVIQVVQLNQPQRDCWQETRTQIRYGSGSATGTILGGVIGGIIGHDLGRGHHQDAATVVGTLLGASIGQDLTHSSQVAIPVTQTHCESRNDYAQEERVVGYRVTYRYSDRTYVTRTERHPGSTIRITVTLDD